MNPINPLIPLDYPDPDVIRVGNTFYMVSTTMYFMPGCEILRSFDLLHWEHASYVYETLDSTPAQRLNGKENIYGQGMWAASIRYHQGTFYIIFVANDTHKTYLFKSKTIEGPWKKSEISGFYHDNSLLFDDDGHIFILSGNRDIYLTELNADLTGPKEGTDSRIIIRDKLDAYLGYEGAHFYKINGYYYIFLIHMPRTTGKRTESCFYARSLDDEFVGLDVMDDDRGFRGMGVAQGGIVDTPDGKWYSILFQDSGAVGRLPILMPITWSKDSPSIPVFGDKGVIPEEFSTPDLNPGYSYAPLFGDDDFKGELKSFWQYNHEPDKALISHNKDKGTFSITTDKLCNNVTQAKNTLTQRCLFPKSKASVMLDASKINEGDYAGLCILQSNYAFVAVTKRNGEYYLIMGNHVVTVPGIWGERNDDSFALELFKVKLSSPKVRLASEASFDSQRYTASSSVCPDKVSFSYDIGDGFIRILQTSSLSFKLDHFTGARYGLFNFSTAEAGGTATFSEFRYEEA
ncbi:glycoside hydrolase family 43 protein [Butyrivibrio hungatei]|uniref:Xylosidase/arabinofuranosidase Xsa43D n=1 Tax=Butyrivibrio hungatei TaxID=185008 RepID=A0A1D9P469_9FIRM|nr:glycoside hydrolase 43 family protein [Butyrivibrio hungatei]AOZ97144.1 xylosidase/arabinofuranosidase Xsa43D [Butyrivibrio hungatei]